MSEQPGGNSLGEKTGQSNPEDNLPEDIIDVVLTVHSYHDAMSEGDYDHAEAIKRMIEGDPERFDPDLITAMEEARKLSIRPRRKDPES